MHQVLVYSDSLSWGIVPTTRRRLPFDARWPGVMEIALSGLGHSVRVIEDCPIEPGMPVPPVLVIAPPPILIPRGPIAPKFTGAADKSVGLAEAYSGIAAELGCGYFDAGSVIAASPADGIHLDAEQHERLGKALAGFVAALPGFATPSQR